VEVPAPAVRVGEVPAPDQNPSATVPAVVGQCAGGPRRGGPGVGGPRRGGPGA
jgi:hypothetical protein